MVTFTKPTVGGNDGTWGGVLNTAIDDIADCFNGVTATTPNLTSGSWKVGGTAITATATQLNYVGGVTSAIQTQIDTKAPTASPTFTGTATIPTAAITTSNISTTLNLANWTVTESGAGALHFSYGGVVRMSLSASGDLTVTGNITAYGTI